MKNKDYFISVGAGSNQIPLIRTAVNIGYKIIAIDKNDKAPGFEFSNIKIMESTSEYRKITNILSQIPLHYPVSGIGTRSYGKSVYTTAFLADKFNLTYFKPESINIFNNKKTLKEFLQKEGIRVPAAVTVAEIKSKKKSAVNFPVIIKPADKHGKKGIRLFATNEELVSEIHRLGKSADEWIIEEYVNGNEITVSGFVQKGKFSLVSISDKIISPQEPFIELGHRFPGRYNFLSGEIITICQNIIHSTSLGNGPVIAEFRITDKNEIFLIEFMPEVGGEFLAEHMIPVHFGYNYFENFINLLCGGKFRELHTRHIKNKLTHLVFFDLPQDKSKYTGYKKRKDPEGIDIFLELELKKPGSISDARQGNHSRVLAVGAVSTKISDADRLDELIRSSYIINPEDHD